MESEIFYLANLALTICACAIVYAWHKHEEPCINKLFVIPSVCYILILIGCIFSGTVVGIYACAPMFVAICIEDICKKESYWVRIFETLLFFSLSLTVSGMAVGLCKCSIIFIACTLIVSAIVGFFKNDSKGMFGSGDLMVLLYNIGLYIMYLIKTYKFNINSFDQNAKALFTACFVAFIIGIFPSIPGKIKNKKNKTVIPLFPSLYLITCVLWFFIIWK